MNQMTYRLRKAALSDLAALETLIARSARDLCIQDYTIQQVEGALRGAFGVDTQLIVDGTYFVVEHHGEIVGCGGWSRRHTLFGGDAHSQRDAGELNPLNDPARIRAYFVHPEHVRKGIGRALLKRCEAEALAYGFSRFELMATLPGVKFYEAQGYLAGASIQYQIDKDLSIEFVPMRKDIQ